MSLTELRIKSLKPGAKLYRVADSDGLCLEITLPGAKLWRYRYRFAGKAKMVSLGNWPVVSLAKARELRFEAAAQLRKGLDPSAERKRHNLVRTMASANTFEAIALEWIDRQRATWSAIHAKRVQEQLTRDVFPYLGARPISEIKPIEILACMRKIEARGAIESAHRALGNFGQVCRYAVATGRLESDPTRDLRGALQPVQHKHLAAITDSKGAGDLIRALRGYQGTPEVRASLLVSAMLFQRPGEIRKMQWSQLDLDAAEWRYFVTKTKSNHLVPLSSQAVALLREIEPLTNRPIKELPNAPRYVFAGMRSRLRPMSENTVRQALRSLGFANDVMTPHGFRAMARSLLAELGWKIDAIERQIAHKASGPLGAAYDRAQFLVERKAMMQAWADYLEKLEKGEGKVVPIGRVA